MVTDMPTRRDALVLLSGLIAQPWAKATGNLHETRMVASWTREGRQEVGFLALYRSESVEVVRRLELPTRAHGLSAGPDGTVLVAARRPGDWLLKWHPASGASTWHWIDDDRQLNGHLMRLDDANQVLTTETDRSSGEGMIGLRRTDTLQKIGEWPSHGMDPHAMLLLPAQLGDIPAGALMVANGGIPTQSETGRSHRQLDRMDPSLIAMDPRSGRVFDQWRLPDSRLSVRHLAFDPVTRRVGVALQAEHDDNGSRMAAPILATWDGHQFSAVASSGHSHGYGGDICARPGGGFVVSATRAHQVVATKPGSALVDRLALPDACALAMARGQWWAAGADHARSDGHSRMGLAGLRLDNHWAWAS